MGVDTHVLSNADFVNKFGTALALRTCHSYERLNALKAYRYVTQALPVTSPVCRYSVVLKATLGCLLLNSGYFVIKHIDKVDIAVYPVESCWM